jgi:PPOX class probable F420-dependent enzyme
MQLTPAEVEAFLAEPHTLVLATLRSDGTPHLTTVWYRWDGSAFWISTNRNRVKYRNVTRDGRVSVLVDAPERETSVTASGHAEAVATDDDAYRVTLEVVGRYVDDAERYLADRADEPRVLIRITPTWLTGWKP